MHDTSVWDLESLTAAATSTLSSHPIEQLVSIQTASITSFIASAASSLEIAAATSTAMSYSNGTYDDNPENTGECKLLGPFAVLVQAALGGLALLVLVFKRWRERPQRPLKIWAFDASKQVFGSVLLHLANLFMSMLSSGQLEASIARAAASTVGSDPEDYRMPNPCSFYLLNLAIDTTIGIPILIVILRVLYVGFSYTPLANPPESIQSGNYGTPPKAGWWLKQSTIYFIGLLGMKFCVFVVFELCPWIVQVGDWALRWTEGNEAIQIAFVMLIFPLIMNALQYYIIDTFIKKRNTAEVESENSEEADHDEQGGLLGEAETVHDVSGDEDEPRKSHIKTAVQSKPKSKRLKSYDPDKDGEIVTPPGESSGSSTSHLEEDAVKQRPVDL